MRLPLLLALTAIWLVGCPSAPSSECEDGLVLDLADTDDLGCVPEACGADPWRGDEGVRVAPWGADPDQGGDGSVDAPLRRIQDAADAAADAGGGAVLVAAGTYVENLMLLGHDGVRLLGRCSALSRMDCSEEEASCVRVAQGDVDVRGLTLADAGSVGIYLTHDGGPAVRFRGSDLVIEGALNAGVIVDRAGTTADLEDVLVRRTLPVGGAFGYGIAVQRGAELVARSLRIEEATSRALLIVDARAELSDSQLVNTQPLPVEGEGLAVDVRDGGTFVAANVAMAGSTATGLLVRDAGTVAELTSCSVVDTAPNSEVGGGGGRGVEVIRGASLTATGLQVQRSLTHGVAAMDPGTTLVLTDSVIRDTESAPDGGLGRGVGVSAGASFQGTRVTIEGNRDAGLAVLEPGSTAELMDSRVAGTRPSADGTAGVGVAVADGAMFVGRGLTLEDNAIRGLALAGGGAMVELFDSTLRGTGQGTEGSVGYGLSVFGPGTLVGEGILVEGTRGLGIAISTGANVTLRDTIVRGTEADPQGVFAGEGLAVSDGATLVGDGLLLDGNHIAGLLAQGAGTQVQLSDSTVQGTLDYEWHPFVGGGLLVHEGAQVDATRVELLDNAGVGAQAEGQGTRLELLDSSVRGTRLSDDAEGGMAVAAARGAHVELRGFALQDNQGGGVLASNGSTLILREGTIAGTRSGARSAGAVLGAQFTGQIDAQDVLLTDNEGPGIYIYSDGAVVLQGVDIVRSGFAGAVVLDGSLEMTDSSIVETQPHPSEGGGVGVYASDVAGLPQVLMQSSLFQDLAGPALYLRGTGSAQMRGCTVRDAGAWPSMPGGVLATGGIGTWNPSGGPNGTSTGLLLAGNRFESLRGDAVLLDGALGTLDIDAAAGPNTFADVPGAPLYVQCGAEGTPAQVLDGSGADPSCRGQARPLGPLLDYELRVGEVGAIE